jgi:hypothetical protein
MKSNGHHSNGKTIEKIVTAINRRYKMLDSAKRLSFDDIFLD